LAVKLINNGAVSKSFAGSRRFSPAAASRRSGRSRTDEFRRAGIVVIPGVGFEYTRIPEPASANVPSTARIA
jgi:hypothetical protein